MIERGPWQVLHSRDVYADPWIRVQIDDVLRPDGNPGIHSIIHLKAGVCVLAMDSERTVFLTEEFHYAVGRVTLEGVSGGCEPGEDSIATAKRELREELGICAETWSPVGVIDPFTANVVSPTALFLAQDLTFVQPEHEGTERIRRVAMPLQEAVENITSGVITHSPTCVLLLRIAIQMTK